MAIDFSKPLSDDAKREIVQKMRARQKDWRQWVNRLELPSHYYNVEDLSDLDPKEAPPILQPSPPETPPPDEWDDMHGV